MSMFERMLEVLGAREAGRRNTFIADLLARVLADQTQSASRRSRRRATRNRRRNERLDPATERLEPRQVLAVNVIAATSRGWVTIVAEGGDNVYIQQNAGNPNSLRIADNSSFTNSTVVGGPTGLGGSSQQLPGVDVHTIPLINISSGTLRRDAGLYARGYPMAEPSVTRFALESDGLDSRFSAVNGRISITQPDGRRDYWDFTSLPGRSPVVTSGIDSASARPGDYYPAGVQVTGGVNRFGRSEIDVIWNVEQLPVSSEPRLESISWERSTNVYGYASGRVIESGVLPASPQSTFIPLTNSAGLGLNEIISSTFSGRVLIEGTAVDITTSGPGSPDLLFNGKTQFAFLDYSSVVFGRVLHNVTGRLITGVGHPVFGTDRGIELTMSDNFPVMLESARYAMPGGGAPVTATIFNGQTIRSALDVNLVQPGSTFNLDSPLDVTAGFGGIKIRATNVTFNAEAETNEDLTFEAAKVSSAQAWERAKAIAQVVNGVVNSIEIPSGWGGAGFDADDPPRVTISAPTGAGGRAATAVAIVNPATTRIVRIQVVDKGKGYTSVPTVQIDPPLSVFNAAKPLATVNSGGQVSGIAFQNGAAMKVLVTGVDRITGAVTDATLFNNGGGRGYSVGDVVVIDSGLGGVGQSAQFRVLEVNDVGGAVRIEIFKGGSGYDRDEVLTHAGSEGRGYGYKVAPRVWISRPTAPDGVQAEAVATIDALGRIASITVTKRGSGYSTAAPPMVTVAAVTTSAQVETVRLNASIAARNYSFTLADDPATSNVPRTTLWVSNTGSLVGADGVSAADSVMIESRQGDIRLEGLVYGRNQSYLMQSNPEDQWLRPFRLTTTAAGSSVPTGLIKGDVVAVTLANDLETPKSGAVAFSEVQLNTEVNNLRIRASRRNGSEVTDPFPYTLDVTEANDVVIDSVASSSFPIGLASKNGSIKLSAAVTTAGGLVVSTANAGFNVTAPVKTTKGQIAITAKSISVGSSLEVTDSILDEAQEDISLYATNGDVVMNGGVVSARNRVAITQRKRDPKLTPFTNGTKTAIAVGSITALEVAVPSGLSVNDIDVQLTVTHPAIGELSATLVAPDGTRVALFDRNAVAGANFANTVFDSEAAAPLRNTGTKAPFTASFQPVGDLSQLYFRPTGGIWRLEMRDWVTDNSGTIDSFTMIFKDPSGQPGGVISGTSLIKADTLSIDAEGSVGKPGTGPGVPGFYLQTDVNTVIGYCLGSFAVSDVDDLDVNSLGANGLVSLRAEGVDPQVDSKTGLATRAALRGNLRDVTAIEVSAPNGSISLEVNTANDVVLGNASNLALTKTIRGTMQPPMVAAGSVRITSVGNSTGGSFQVLDAPLAGGNAKQAKVALTISNAQALYDVREPGRYAATITARANGSLTTLASGIKRGDRILVNNAGTTANPKKMNGLYAVTAVGDAFTKWQLTRVADADTAAELLSNTIVAVNDGSGAASKYYRVTYPALGATLFGDSDITVIAMEATPGTSLLTTGIGSNDPTDTVDFIVSTTDGMNDSPGSLGKMIRLRQENVPATAQKMNFLFSSAFTKDTPVRLEQELPIVTKAFEVNGKLRYRSAGSPASSASPDSMVIDGSRIRTTRYGEQVSITTSVNGIIFASGSGGAALSNITIGGFNQQDQIAADGTPIKQSAAIIVDGASNVTMEGVVVGEDGLGGRLGSVHGIIVRNAGGASSGAVSSGVLIKNSRISSAARAGVSLEGGTKDAWIYGSTIGLAGRDNETGISVTATGAGNRIGSLEVDRVTGKSAAANVVSFNRAGIKLGGAVGTSVVNTVVNSNNTDGILITAGSNSIGVGAVPAPPKPAAPVANQIAMNKGWGVRIDSATLDAAKSLAKNQKIFGNYFVVPEADKNDRSKQNLGLVGAVTADQNDYAVGLSVNGAAASVYLGEPVPATGNAPLQPYPVGNGDASKDGIDPNGNQHFGVGDNVGPSLTLLSPVDLKGVALVPTLQPADTSVRLTGAAASGVRAFVMSLRDLGGGLLASTVVKEAFTVRNGATKLTEGKDYRFQTSGTAPATLRFEMVGIGTLPLGAYTIEATPNSGRETAPGSFGGGKLTDKSNNILEGNKLFTITLAGAQAPTQLTAVAGDGEVSLSWSQPVDTGDADIEGYAIQSSTNSGGTWVNVIANTTSSLTTAALPSLTNGVTYTFRVAAITAAGQGVFSAPSAPVKPGLLPPGKPVAVATGGQIALEWSAPAATSGIIDYVVQQSGDAGKTWTKSTNPPLAKPGDTTLQTTVPGLNEGTQYIFRVAAVSAVGQGNWSLESTPVLLLSAPRNVVASSGNSQILLNWAAPPTSGPLLIQDYVVQTSRDGGTTWSDVADAVSASTTASVVAINGLKYVCRVAAKTSAGLGEWSLPTSEVTPIGQATAPLSVQATPGDSKIDLRWEKPMSDGGAAITDYVIELSTDGGNRWVLFQDGIGTSTSATVPGLTNGTAYVFRIAATTVYGVGDRSQASAEAIPRRPAAAPVNLVVVGGDGSATLTWNAPADGGLPISDYSVEYRTAASATWNQWARAVSTATSATVTGLVNGTSYVFRVAAKTAAGTGAWTVASNAVIPARLATAPRTVQATAGDGYVVLTWLPPDSTGGTAVTDYVAQRSTDGGRTWTAVSDGISTATKMTAAGLVNGSAHVFRVAAVTSAGTGAWSTVTTAVVPRGPATAPLAVQAIAGNGQVVLSWSPPASLGGAALRDYIVQASTNGGATWSTLADGVSTASSMTVTGLANGTAYVYRVAAVTDFATGVFSAATAAVVPLAAPGTITGLQVLAGSGQATLRWQAPAANGGRPVSDYTIEYQAVGTTTWTPWSHAPSAATAATITGLAADTAYLFRVRAVTSFASGAPVATAEAVVPLAPPTSLIGRASSGSVALSWLPPRLPATTRIIDYRVQYSVDGVNWITAADGVSAASRTTVRGLTNGTAYLFRVAAVTAKGVGSYSAVSNWLRPAGPVRRA